MLPLKSFYSNRRTRLAATLCVSLCSILIVLLHTLPAQAGGKGKLLDRLQPLFPPKFNRYKDFAERSDR
ncbi:MAG TPA: hypothetical protein VFK30_16415 [Anaerolineae bacterium]|nr:hypothetical protein [Anaerolineae bacterium]